MGYTHYYTVPPIEDLGPFAADVRAIVLASGIPVAGWDGTGEPNYGIDEGFVQPPEWFASYGAQVALNGVGADAHESFVIHENGGWTFCETAYKPYDVIVTASLLALRDRTGAKLESDGDASDWAAGHALAERALHRPIAPFAPDDEDAQ